MLPGHPRVDRQGRAGGWWRARGGEGGNQLEPQVVQEAAERSRNIGDQSEGVDRLDAVAARIQSSPPQGGPRSHKRLCPKEPARSPQAPRGAGRPPPGRASPPGRNQCAASIPTYLKMCRSPPSDSNRSPTRGACPFSRNSTRPRRRWAPPPRRPVHNPCASPRPRRPYGAPTGTAGSGNPACGRP